MSENRKRIEELERRVEELERLHHHSYPPQPPIYPYVPPYPIYPYVPPYPIYPYVPYRQPWIVSSGTTITCSTSET